MAKKQAAQPRRKATSSSELDKECQAILDLLANEEDEHWQIGAHYGRIVEERLYEGGGFKTAREFVSQRLGGIAQSTLTLYGAIAKSFPEEIAKKYGSTLLGELITYESASKTPLPQGDPGKVTIRVPKSDGSTTDKLFADCSREEMRAAVRHLHSPAKPKPIPPDDRRTLDALAKTLEQQLGGGQPIVMRAQRGRPDTVITFKLTIQYLGPLRDVLWTVLGKPDDVPVRGVQANARAKTATANGRTWSRHKGRSRTPKADATADKGAHRAFAAKSKQLSRRHGRAPNA